MKITNHYFETLATKNIQELLNKQFTAKTSFFLARLFDKIDKESKYYFAQKQKLVNQYAQKDEEGNPIQKDGMVVLDNPEKFTSELEEVLKININFEGEKIKIDFSKEPFLTINEVMILLPFIEESCNE